MDTCLPKVTDFCLTTPSMPGDVRFYLLHFFMPCKGTNLQQKLSPTPTLKGASVLATCPLPSESPAPAVSSWLASCRGPLLAFSFPSRHAPQQSALGLPFPRHSTLPHPTRNPAAPSLTSKTHADTTAACLSPAQREKAGPARRLRL